MKCPKCGQDDLVIKIAYESTVEDYCNAVARAVLEEGEWVQSDTSPLHCEPGETTGSERSFLAECCDQELDEDEMDELGLDSEFGEFG